MPDVSPRLPERPLRWSDAVLDLQDLLADVDQPAWLVGGVVRDALLGRPTKDVDIVTSGSGTTLARIIANRMDGAYFPLDAERDVGRALVDRPEGRLMIDVAGFRGDSLEADLLDRDFTLNAMAADLHGDLTLLIDPLGGEQDAINRLIRRCNPDSIPRDVIRSLRAIRFAMQFTGRIERETQRDVRAAAPRLFETSPERVRDEFMRILALPDATRALNVADALGLLTVIIPELRGLHGMAQPAPHVADGWQHTLAVVEAMGQVLDVISPTRTDATGAQFSLGMLVMALDRFRAPLQQHVEQTYPEGRTHRALLILAALLHDSGKPTTATTDAAGRPHFARHAETGAAIARERADVLRLSSAERQLLVAIVGNHMRPLWLQDISPLSIHRFWHAVGEAGIDVCLLAMADYLGTFGVTLQQDDWLRYLERIQALLEAWYERYDQLVQPPVLIDGNGLMKALDLKPGRVVGDLLDLIREAQVTGDVVTAADALRLAGDYVSRPTSPPDP